MRTQLPLPYLIEPQFHPPAVLQDGQGPNDLVRPTEHGTACLPRRPPMRDGDDDLILGSGLFQRERRAPRKIVQRLDAEADRVGPGTPAGVLLRPAFAD